MTTEKNPGVTVGSIEPRRFGTRIKMLVAITVVIGVGVGAYLFFVRDTSGGGYDQKAAQKKVDDAVYKRSLNPDYAAAEKELQRQLQDTSDKKKQADIYVKLATLAIGQNNYAGFVENEQKAAKLDPSRADLLARSIADAFMQLGKKSDALPYYKQALKYYQSRPDTYIGKQYYITDITAKIKDIEK